MSYEDQEISGHSGAPVECYRFTSGVSLTHAFFVVTKATTTPKNHHVSKIRNDDGSLPWGATGVQVSSNTVDPTSSLYNSGICPGPAGGCVVVWIDANVNASGRVKAQLLDKDGNKMWGANGITITDSSLDTRTKTEPRVVPDGLGNFIVGWQDTRNTANFQPFAQKLSASGAAQWTANGVLLDTSTLAKDGLRLVQSSSGATIFAYRRSTSVLVVKVDAAGAISWGPTASITGVSFPWGEPCSDGAGGVFLIGEASLRVKFHRLDSAGASAFAVLTIGSATLDSRFYGVCRDGGTGAIAWWHEKNSAGSPSAYTIRAQHVNASGALQWVAGGVAVFTTPSSAVSPTRPYTVAAVSGGGSICTYTYDNAGVSTVVATKLSAAGALDWTTVIQAGAQSGAKNMTMPDGSEGIFTLWFAANSDARVRRVSTLGVLEWTADTQLSPDETDGVNHPIAVASVAVDSAPIIYRWTSADEPIVLPDGTYEPIYIRRSQIDYSQEDASGQVKVKVHRTNPVAAQFISYPPASPITLSVLRKHRDDAEVITYWVGHVIGCMFEGPTATLTCSPERALERRIPVPIYQGLCNRVLYGPGCLADKAAFTVGATVDSIVGLDVTATEFGTQPDGWFRGGYLEVPETGEQRPIVAHVGETITIQYPFVALAAGASVNAVAGCDRTEATCDTKFSNLDNHLGFPDIPSRNPYTSAVS